MTARPGPYLVGLFLLLLMVSTAHGQTPFDADRQALEAVYHLDGPGWNATFAFADMTAYPVGFGAAPAAWVFRAFEGEKRYADAWRLTVASAVSFGLTVGIKQLVRRERPFRAVPGIDARTRFLGARAIDRYSFPSGHAALAAAVAVSWSLSHPEWYLIGPAAAWAGIVGISRSWLGVHYPSDVLAGWVLGVAVGWAVHALGDQITPVSFRDEGAMPMVHLRLGLGS
jgi:membrane-associated phospholipid phosphatase